MALIIPHVRRAVLIGKTIHHKDAEAMCFTDILDRLSAGMILVDATAASFTPMLPATPSSTPPAFCAAAGGRLVAGDAESTALARGPPATAAGDAALGVKGMTLPLAARSGERYVTHVFR